VCRVSAPRTKLAQDRAKPVEYQRYSSNPTLVSLIFAGSALFYAADRFDDSDVAHAEAGADLACAVAGAV
jgi:hypothetical protein